MNPGRSEQKRQNAILNKGGRRWPSGEGVQNRMALTGTPSVVDTQASYKELKRGFQSFDENTASQFCPVHYRTSDEI
jgi:hypothetical protein